jgi:hypothetical protein
MSKLAKAITEGVKKGKTPKKGATPKVENKAAKRLAKDAGLDTLVVTKDGKIEVVEAKATKSDAAKKPRNDWYAAEGESKKLVGPFASLAIGLKSVGSKVDRSSMVKKGFYRRTDGDGAKKAVFFVMTEKYAKANGYVIPDKAA